MNSRNYALDLLKVFATIIILLHHAQGSLGIQFARFNFYNGRFYFGYVVELFFMISGFLTYDTDNSIMAECTFSDYFVKKVIRLIPMVGITSLVTFVFLYMQWGTYHIWGLLVSALGFYSFGGESFDIYKVNAPVWYISVLLLCYVWFYIIEFIGKKLHISTKWIHLAFSIMGMVGLSYHIDFPFFNGHTNRGYFAFFGGAVLKWFVDNYIIQRKTVIFAACCVIGYIIIYFVDYSMISYNPSEILVIIVYPSLIILTQSEWVTKVFKPKSIVFLSKVSYGVYLWHTPIYTAISSIKTIFCKGIKTDTVFFLFLYCLVTLIVSIFSFQFIEKPITRVLNDLYENRINLMRKRK